MPELKEYELDCPHCLGKKYVGPFRNVCGKCMGTGKLDWIENIVGKKIDLDVKYEQISKEIEMILANSFKVNQSNVTATQINEQLIVTEMKIKARYGGRTVLDLANALLKVVVIKNAM